MFKVNKKDSRMTPINFEHVIAGWDRACLELSKAHNYHSNETRI